MADNRSQVIKRIGAAITAPGVTSREYQEATCEALAAHLANMAQLVSDAPYRKEVIEAAATNAYRAACKTIEDAKLA